MQCNRNLIHGLKLQIKHNKIHTHSKKLQHPLLIFNKNKIILASIMFDTRIKIRHYQNEMQKY